MARYRKKPVEIDAILYDGKWTTVAEWLQSLHGDQPVFQPGEGPPMEMIRGQLFVNTMEGRLLVKEGAYIIRGLKGEFYPCDPTIFAMTYDPVDP